MDLKMQLGKKKEPKAEGSETVTAPPQAGGAIQVTATGLPQVDLLPPSVRDGRRLSARKRVLFYAELIVIAAVILAIAFVYFLKLSADTRLSEAEDRSTQLIAEKMKYSEVTGVIRAIDDTIAVRDFSIVTEVDWALYIDAVAAVLPAGVYIDSFDIDQASPTSPPPTAGDPVLATGLGTITFVAKSPGLPNAADWADALNGVTGFQDASIQVATLEESASESESSSGDELYTVNATVQINELALANRTFETDDEAQAQSDDDADTSGKEDDK